MSSILEKSHTFRFSESYSFADKVRKAIFERDYAIDPLEVAKDVELQVAKPQKRTLLHDYIEYVVVDHLNFYFRGGGWEFEDVLPVLSMLESHQIEYQELDHYIKEVLQDDESRKPVEITEEHIDEYKHQYAWDYIEPLVQAKFVPVLVTEVFSLLFADREAMKVFNISVAESMGERSKRNTYWPKWLERALFCREKGLCALCKTDLSSVYHTYGKVAIDHIVPIAQNGVNDPTNLQILCQSCNSKKSGTVIETSNAMPVFWEM